MTEIHVTQSQNGFSIEINQLGGQKQCFGTSPCFPEAVTLAFHAAKTHNIPEECVLFHGVKVREVLKQ